MAINLRTELRKPVPIALAILAVLGWAVVLSMSVSRSALEQEMHAQLETA